MISEIAYFDGNDVRYVYPTSYPDGMPLVRAPERSPTRLLLRPRSSSGLMAALWWVDTLPVVPELILPCVPGARQDRPNPTGDVLFTAKSVAREINLRNFPRVTMLDPHSDVAPALIDRSVVVSAADCFGWANDYAAVVSPDGGAEKRAGAVARRLGVPLIHAWKSRDVKTGRLAGFGVQPAPDGLADGALLVVDDLCDGGGTFLGLSSVLDTYKRRLQLYVTHGLFTSGVDKLSACYDRIFTTDSVLGSTRDGVTEFDICDRLLRGRPLL